MEILGYIIGFVSLGLGVIIALIRKVDSDVVDAMSAIEGEYLKAYMEFARTALGEVTTTEGQRMSATRLKNLHCFSILDVPKLSRIEVFLKLSLKAAVYIVVGSVASLLVGRFVYGEGELVARGVFLIGIPCLLVVVEFVMIFLIVGFERYLKRTLVRYNNLEYEP